MTSITRNNTLWYGITFSIWHNFLHHLFQHIYDHMLYVTYNSKDRLHSCKQLNKPWPMWRAYSFFSFFNLKNFLLLFNYSCLHFLPTPPPHLSQTHLPPPPPPSPCVLWCVLYSSSWKPLSTLSPPHSPLAIVRLLLTSLSLVIFCLLFSFVGYVPVKGEIIWYLCLTAWLISLSIMIGGYGQIRAKKMKLDHQLTQYTKINSRGIKDLNISRNTIKILEENIGRKISDIPHSNILTDKSSKARDIKDRINKWDLIKIKSFCMAKEKSIKMKIISLKYK